MPEYTWTHETFDELSWHDNHIHALRVVEGEHGLGSLVLVLDHILEWLQAPDDKFRFRILPCTLTFFEVCNLRILLDYAAPTAALTPFSIHRIHRTTEQRERYEATLWRIEINWPEGEITSEASGFEQVGSGNPRLASEQWLSKKERGSRAVQCPLPPPSALPDRASGGTVKRQLLFPCIEGWSSLRKR